MARFRGGSNPIDLPAPSGGVTVGEFVLIGELLVFAQSSAAQGEIFTAVREGIIVEALGPSNQEWEVGDALYWNPTGHFTSSSSNRHFAGWAYRAKPASTTHGSIILDYTHAT